MQKKHLVLAALILLILIILGGIFLKKGPAGVPAPQNAETSAGEGPRTNIDEAMKLKPGSTAAAPTGVTKLTPPAAQIPWPPELKNQLKAFDSLQNKSVMTPAEEEARLKMLQDPDLISRLGNLLRSRAAQQDPQAMELQNNAIDFLIEALKEGNEQAAADAIWEQIRDGQVEDANIPLRERQTLAGIKGEILYHATALRPDTFQDIEMDLPGPVSQKIWKNVQAQHEANLEGSQAEVDEHLFNQPQNPGK